MDKDRVVLVKGMGTKVLPNWHPSPGTWECSFENHGSISPPSFLQKNEAREWGHLPRGTQQLSVKAGTGPRALAPTGMSAHLLALSPHAQLHKHTTARKSLLFLLNSSF